MTGQVLGDGRHFTARLPAHLPDRSFAVGDTDITAIVEGFDLTCWRGRPTVRLYLDLVEHIDLDTHGTTVTLAQRTHDILTAAGWVPPDQAELIGPIVELARRWRQGGAFTQALVDAVDAYEIGLINRA